MHTPAMAGTIAAKRPTTAKVALSIYSEREEGAHPSLLRGLANRISLVVDHWCIARVLPLLHRLLSLVIRAS